MERWLEGITSAVIICDAQAETPSVSRKRAMDEAIYRKIKHFD